MRLTIAILHFIAAAAFAAIGVLTLLNKPREY